MQYKQIPAPEHLKAYVRYFWTLEAPPESNAPQSFRTIADGSPGLIFHQVEQGSFYQNEKLLPDIFLYGQATTHAEIRATGKLRAVGIFFHPNALKSVFGLNAGELTDTCVDVNILTAPDGISLSEQLVNTPSINHQIDLLSSWLHTQAGRNYTRNNDIMQYAVSAIARSKGNISLKKVQMELLLTERSFERKFKEYIGISPKLFSRICRFQASLQQLKSNDYQKLSDIAFENEYSDQSHFIRAFKEFAGFSPFQYQKQVAEVFENLTAPIK
ncbi:AraC family transcriptional regulator [Pseudoflavitalea sp. X16]|uniref:helix-turn-helix domain-containing protein n=1 Tax=Paraflavitalea devenefica TaxID=2716334 RepID=UPI00141FC11E|nr:helix-turn-helix domain-containing protein [Paraflavitalea devenefica]NII28864.1 AraC family transcriptional regulator [Paraflavitalea devenefica]